MIIKENENENKIEGEKRTQKRRRGDSPSSRNSGLMARPSQLQSLPLYTDRDDASSRDFAKCVTLRMGRGMVVSGREDEGVGVRLGTASKPTKSHLLDALKNTNLHFHLQSFKIVSTTHYISIKLYIKYFTFSISLKTFNINLRI